MKLLEILNISRPFTLDETHPGFTRYSFTTKNGSKVIVEFSSVGNALKELEKIHDFAGIEFSVDGSVGLTGKFESIEIFSTIKEIVKDFIKETRIDSFCFASAYKAKTKSYIKLFKYVDPSFECSVIDVNSLVNNDENEEITLQGEGLEDFDAFDVMVISRDVKKIEKLVNIIKGSENGKKSWYKKGILGK